MCSCPDAFLSLRSCAIEVVGVAGSLPISGIGTVMLVVRSTADLPFVVLVHDCLLSQGSSFNLLSVSQFQSSGLNSVDFTMGSPLLRIHSRCVHSRENPVSLPLVLQDGLFSFYAEPLHPNDDRARTLPDSTGHPSPLGPLLPCLWCLAQSPSFLFSPPFWAPGPLRYLRVPLFITVFWLFPLLVILILILSFGISVMVSCLLLLPLLHVRLTIPPIPSTWLTSPHGSWVPGMNGFAELWSSIAVFCPRLDGSLSTLSPKANSSKGKPLV